MERRESPKASPEIPVPQSNDTLVAASVIGTHSFEHIYGRGFLVLIPKIFDSLGLANYQAGLLEAVRQVTSGLTSMGGGLFSDMFEHRRTQILAISMALIGIGYLLVAVSPTYALILAALILPAIGTAMWHPPALGLLSQRFPWRRGLFISLHRSTGNIGDSLAPIAVGILLGVLSWRWVLGGGTPVVILSALLLLVFLRNAGGARPKHTSLGSNLKDQLAALGEALEGKGLRKFAAIFAVSAARGMGDRALLWMIPLYLSENLGKSDFLIGLHVALLQAPGIIAAPLLGDLSDRIGRKPIIIFIMGVTALMPVTMVAGGGGLGMTLSIALFGLLMSSVNSLTQAAAMDMVEGRRLNASFIGLMWGGGAFFGAAAAVAAGGLADLVNREAAFYFASLMFMVGFVASFALPSTRGPATGGPATARRAKGRLAAKGKGSG